MSGGSDVSSSISMNLSVVVKETGKKGRGVFAGKNFVKGEIIETCPIVYLSPKERTHCEHTILAYYLYPWTSMRCGAMVLGYGSIYNHSFTPNTQWKQDFHAKTMIYQAVRNIKTGEEITVNYNGKAEDQKPIDWFGEFAKKYQ
ncbi:MAG: SET domain-containing protein [Candidatus Gottesmanbacteria bacterium]